VSGERLLYLATEDWAFCSNRLPLAVAARKVGYRVAVATRVARHGDQIRGAGLELFPLHFRRGLRGPTDELGAFREILRTYRRFAPDLVHHVAIKPILLGSLAARVAGVPCVVNALTGRGFVFVSDRWFARALRPGVRAGLRLASRGRSVRVLLQNADDFEIWGDGWRQDSNFVVIRGSGVDTDRFVPSPEPPPPVVVTMPARLLWDKGVGEFVEAARRLRADGVRARFRLVGDTDEENPAGVSREQLGVWHEEGVIEWSRWQEDMGAVYDQSHVVCLPSYAEGLPKVLLEAAACARAIVATDVPGCREIVRDGDTGLLVPARDAIALSAALRRLIDDPGLRARLGRRGRTAAEEEFGLKGVVGRTLEVYAELLRAGAGAQQRNAGSVT
jgi:glycosyltransferase involved in cell wall biosynthesis